MDTTTVISTLIGAIIGTALGSWILVWRGESGLRKVRKTAIDALDLFKKYGRQDKTYYESMAEFNRVLNIAQKRSVLVALQKIGIPIASPITGEFDIKNVSFFNEKISLSAIDDMKDQIESGNCDKLFFLDIEKYFNEDLRIRTMRDVAIRFVNDVAKKSKLNTETRKRIFDDGWENSLSLGQFNTIIVFSSKINDTSLYTKEGNPKIDSFDSIIEEIKVGLWDKYLNTDELEYNNLQAQCSMAQFVAQGIAYNMQPQQSKCANFKPIEEQK